MVNSEYYWDFIEGTQSYGKEIEFFHLLSSDDEFRDGFRSFLTITSVISKNIASYSATKEEKASIFAALGYALPEEVTNKKIEKSKPFYKKPFLKYFSTFVLSSLMTLMLYFFLINNNVAHQHSNTKSNKSSLFYIKNLAYNSERIYKIPNNLLKESEFTTNQNPISTNTLYALNDLKTENRNSYFVDKNIDIEKTDEKYEMIRNSNPDYLAQNILNIKDELNNKTQKNNLNYDTVYFIRSYDSRMIFEMKNTPAWYFNEPLVQQDNPSKFDDVSLGILFPVYKWLFLGLELKQETFYVEYEGTNKEGKKVMIYKDPNLSSLGLNVRYGSFLIHEKMKPLIQIGMLYNKYGFISKGMLGIEYNPYDFVYLLIGAELNSFFYQHESKWNISNKFSFNYGIGVRF